MTTTPARSFLLAAGLLCGAALLWPDVAWPCEVKVEIAELVERYGSEIQRACRPGIAAVRISGDRERVVYELRWEQDWTGLRIAGTPHLKQEAERARYGCEVLRAWLGYGTEECLFHVSDVRGHPICSTKQADEGSGTYCVDVVGEGDARWRSKA